MKIKLRERETGKKIEAEILYLSKKEAKAIKKDILFGFDWEKEIQFIALKIELSASHKIVGLMSLIDHPNELRMEINLLEVSRDNKGSEKKIENIAGCLIAFACRTAFDKGYQGFVSLVPKTTLIDHYLNAYGFQQYGRQLAIEMERAERLMKKYLSYEQ